MKKKIYHWQPELSVAIIYWSCTFSILCLSLILMLEHTQPYLVSNLVLVVFFVFAYLGFRRYFVVNSTELIVHGLFPTNRKTLKLSELSMIRVGPKSIEIYAKRLRDGSQLFMMTKKNKAIFIKKIQEQKNFTGTIVEDELLKMEKQTDRKI